MKHYRSGMIINEFYHFKKILPIFIKAHFDISIE